MRALILAAGEGRRMQPVTLTTPKPLVEVAGTPMAVRQILALRKAGVEEIVLNVAHLGDRIVETLGDGSAWGVRLRYSVEGRTTGRRSSRASSLFVQSSSRGSGSSARRDASRARCTRACGSTWAMCASSRLPRREFETKWKSEGTAGPVRRSCR